MKELWQSVKDAGVNFKGRQSKMVISEGNLVPESDIQPELPITDPRTMLPGVDYTVMGVTGLESEPFDPPPTTTA